MTTLLQNALIINEGRSYTASLLIRDSLIAAI